MGEAVLRRVVDHLASLGDQPACGDVDVAELCRSMREAAPEEGVPLDGLLDSLFDDWVPRSFTTPGPGYLAFIPGGGLYPAALADFIACATNRFTGVWAAAPALVQLESNVLDWLADWMGYPETARGLLTPGGSMANFSAVFCAREKLLGEHLRQGTVYASDQVHHSVPKAAKLAGILGDRVRSIPSDADFRLRPDALVQAIEADRAAGLRPFLVVSSAGTTNTGAVDPLDAIADICAAEGLWHHVDGAYGATFHMVPELRGLLAGLPRADSITLDPHKGLFLPYGTGALLVRNGEDLRDAYAATAGYLPDHPEDLYDPSQYGPELSRDYRGLRVWLPVKLYGTARLRAALTEKRALTLHAAEAIGALPGIVMTAPPQLSLFAFHLTWPGASLDDENAATEELLNRVVARGRVMITGCRVVDRYLARVCVLSFRTRADRVDACVEDVTTAAAAVLAERTTGRA
jgi:aromatic-L-amino-acid decarboxylase